MGTLKDRGWRFVFDGSRNGWMWKHPNDVLHSDVDGTDMSDEEFKAAVIKSGAA